MTSSLGKKIEWLGLYTVNSVGELTWWRVRAYDEGTFIEWSKLDGTRIASVGGGGTLETWVFVYV